MTIFQLITTYQCVWNFLYFRKILPTVKPSNPRFFTWIWFITYSKWREKLKEIEFILNLTFHHNASLYEKSLFTSDEIFEATEWVCVRSYHLYWDSTLKMKFNPICQGKCRQFWLYEHNVFSPRRTIHLKLLIWSPWNIYLFD